MNTSIPRQLKMLGIILFLVGLVIGTITMQFRNPKMALSAHLEGLMNGMFLIICGFLWNEISITTMLKKALLYALLYGTFANVVFSVLAAIFGTSNKTPIAGAGFTAMQWQETLVSGGLVSLVLAMIFSVALMIYGLRAKISS
jgi:(hydroxyamino)benzene mutase